MTERLPSDPIAAVTHANPYPYYAGLVARSPLAYDDALGLWIAASAEAVTAVLTSHLCRVRPAAEPVPRALLGSPAAVIFGHLVRMSDGPGHDTLKRAVSAALGSIDGPRAAGSSQEWARRLAAELTQADAPRHVTDFAFRLPVYVVGQLLGVPREKLPLLARWMGELVPALAPGSLSEQVERGQEAAGLLLDFFESLLMPGEDLPAEGLLPILAREMRCMEEDVEKAILANSIGLLVQAHDATAGLIGNALLALAARPDICRQTASDPGLLRQAILEILRYDPPVQNTRRFVARDGLVAGRPMKEGDAVLVVLAAANRDPAIHTEPDQFDIFREDRRLFTFGIGRHACPGETLAVTIAQAGVESLLCTGIDFERLAEKVIYRPSVNARIPLFGSWSEDPR